jgi:hypothetical protein
MNSEEDTLGKGRCKCLFRHERNDIAEGLVMLLDKRRMNHISEQLKAQRHEVDPIFESEQMTTLDVLRRARHTPLCIEEYKD